VVKGRLPYLWNEWITSVDHKRIGVMYTLLATVMLLRGFADAIMMRAQQAIAYHSQGYLPPEHFNQIFSAHGTIMIFFVAMPFVIGLMNLIVPMQLGVRDVAFPTLNSVGFWLTATGALLVNISLVIGEFARTGWLPYPPLSELTYSPGVGVDYYLWALTISGIGTLVAGINLVTTVLKLRTRGMTYLRMPMFCWTSLASNLLIVPAFPILTATLAMLILDRYLGFHFFSNEAGGNVMMFMNLIWAWGHPEVYILVLPAFGIFSEVVSTFSGKPLFGYRSMVLATMAICIISFMVWLHHFFTMGAGPDVNAIFGIASMIIAVPTRREDIQLAVHDVWRADSLCDADVVVGRIHGDVHHRRFDRCPGRRAARGLPAAQRPVSGRSFSQCDYRRRAVRRLRRLHLLVSEGIRLPAA
jgi:cytochrome o ubiquinol oxidase subunit I